MSRLKGNKRSYKEKSKRVSVERKVRAFYRRACRIAFSGFLIVFFSALGWLTYSGYIEQYKNDIAKKTTDFGADMGLSLEIVYIEGLNYLDEDVVRAVLPQEEVPLLSVSLNKLKRKIEAIGWVESVDIHRKLPNTLYVHIVERVPSAIWQHNGNLRLIDRSGALISLSDIAKFSYLPILVGEDANIHAANLLTFLTEEKTLMHRISSIIRVGGRRWNVRFKNGIEVKLPEDNPDIRWRHLAKMQREKRILDRDLKRIDLRDKNIIYLTPNEDKA